MGGREQVSAQAPIDLVWIAFEALTVAPFYEAASLLTELSHDGVEVGVMAPGLARKHVRDVLYDLGLLEMLDYIWHREALSEADPDELRRLASPTTLAIKDVRQVRYETVRGMLRRRTRKAPVWELRAPLSSTEDAHSPFHGHFGDI